MIDKDNLILCAKCGESTQGFSMRSVFVICKNCMIEDGKYEREVNDYLKKVEDYIEEKGSLWISEKLYNIISGVNGKDHNILLNSDLFKDSITKIYGKPFNMIKSEELKIILREKTINEILK